MELIKGFVLTIFSGIVARQLTREFSAWTPWIIARLIGRAVSKLPESQRSRFEEEWRCHIDEIPGEVGKLFAAIGFSSAARRMSLILDSSPRRFIVEGMSRRIFDVCVSFLALILLAPLMLTVGVIIRLESDGPILFQQACQGPNGRVFSIWKFRTMKYGAGRTKLHSDLPELISNPRITRVGRLLRKYSLDTLPMFFNILQGDMTLLGPRSRD